MDLESKVDELFKPYRGGQTPGAVVMVIKNGQAIFKKAYGLAHLNEKVAMQTHSNLRLASVTKQFTAACILLLKERALLSLEQNLIEIFPDFPEYGRQITVRHLLQHTSGMLAYESLIPDSATVQVRDKDILQMMMQQDSTYFTPGTAYRYSNSGYAVLAMIVEKISGQTFADFLQKNIFQPLNMKNTVAYEKGKSEVAYRSYGYAEEDGRFIFKDQSLTSAVLGDGGIYTSVEDMFKWDQTLYSERLLQRASLHAAFTPGVLANGDTLEYGFGWRIDTYRGHARVHHTGSTCGFRNVIQRYPTERFTVIILTNRAEPDVVPLANKLTDWFLIES